VVDMSDYAEIAYVFFICQIKHSLGIDKYIL
jgi:hypothetical protein